MTEHFHHFMDRQIFNLGLSVEAVSLYIIITSVIGENVPPTMEVIESKWTSTKEILDRSLSELLDRHVAVERTGPSEEVYYYPQPASLWH